MEVSACIVPYSAVLGDTMPSFELQPSHGFLQKRLIETETVPHMYGAIQCSIEKHTEFVHLSMEFKISFKVFAVGKIAVSFSMGLY